MINIPTEYTEEYDVEVRDEKSLRRQIRALDRQFTEAMQDTVITIKWRIFLEI